MRYFADIEFDGTAYSGWQIQPHSPSVQQTLEEALHLFLREEVSVTGAGRTDAGVHARAMTANTALDTRMTEDEIQDYMNKLWKICYETVYNNKYYRFDENYNLAEFTPDGKTDDEKAKNCISQIIDIKSLADMYIYNEIVCDPDLYLTSFFMDIDFGKDGDKLLRFEAPWDFDSTMGNKRHCADAKGMFAGVKGYDVNYSDFGHGNPWMFIFIQSNWFKQLVKEEWEKAKKTNPAQIADDLIDSYSAYPVSFENNRITWGNPSDDNELCPASKKAAKESQEAAASYLKNWINTRIKEVDSIINKL